MNRLVTASIVTVILVGCNSILSNERGELATEDQTTNEPTSPSTSSSSGGSSGGNQQDSGASPISGDAGQPTPPDGGQCATGQRHAKAPRSQESYLAHATPPPSARRSRMIR